MDRLVLTVTDSAKYLGVSVDTVYSMVQRKELDSFRIKDRILLSQTALNTWREKKQKIARARAGILQPLQR